MPLRTSAKWAWILLISMVFAWRGRETLTHPQLWAEDGVFLMDAIAEGLRLIFVSVAGYFHVLPRLIAWTATEFDPAWIPAIFVYASFGFTLATVLRIFSPRLPLSGKPWLALAIVAVPHSGEVYLTPTNLQWIVVFMLVTTLLSDDPKTRSDWMADLATIAVIGLTGPFCIFLAPLFFLRALVRRTGASWCLLGPAIVVALLQGWQVWFHSPPPPPTHPHEPIDFFRAWVTIADGIPIALFAGKLWVRSISPGMSAAIGLLFAAFLIWLVSSPDRQRPARITLAGFLGFLLVVAVAKTRVDSWPHGEIYADRYFFIPKVVVLWLIASSLARETARGRVAAGALVVAGVAAIAVFNLDPLPRHPWEATREKLSNGRSMEIEINPGWRFVLPSLDVWHSQKEKR